MIFCYPNQCNPNNLTSDCIVEGVNFLLVRAVEALEQAPHERVAPSLNALSNSCEGLDKLRQQILSLVPDLVAGFCKNCMQKEEVKILAQWLEAAKSYFNP